MGWLALVIVLLGGTYFVVNYRSVRKALLIIGGIVLGLSVVLAVAAFVTNYFEEKKRAIERTAALMRIKPSQIEVADAELQLGSLGQITATVSNRSTYTLTELTLRIQVFDCAPSDVLAGKQDCAVVGENTVTEYGFNIPPQQRRRMEEYVSFNNLPALKPDAWTWRYEIVAISGE